MLFYTYQYFENQSKINNIFKYLIGLVILLFFFFTIIKYLQNRLSSKYRDLYYYFNIEYYSYAWNRIYSLTAEVKLYLLKLHKQSIF